MARLNLTARGPSQIGSSATQCSDGPACRALSMQSGRLQSRDGKSTDPRTPDEQPDLHRSDKRRHAWRRVEKGLLFQSAVD